MVRIQPVPAGVELVLLGLLAQQPRHGYELHKQLEELRGIGLVWRIKQANLYALLDKLERKGWLRSQVVKDEEHQARKQYTVCEAGRRAWLTWQQSPVRHGRDMRQDFLSRWYFARQRGPQAAGELIARQRDTCCQWLLDLNEKLSALPWDEAFDRSVYQFRIAQVQAMLAWLDQLAKETSTEILTTVDQPVQA